jgi:hypothetical protein
MFHVRLLQPLPCPPPALAAALLAFTLGAWAGAVRADDARPAQETAPRLEDIKGQYDLADGRTLSITGSAHTIRAQLNGRSVTILLPAGGAVFRAADGAFSATFEQHANGIVTAVTVDEAPAGK